MAGRIADADADRARDAVRRESWAEAYEELSALDPAGTESRHLEALADAAWWLSRSDESIAARQRAHAAYIAAGEDARAGGVVRRARECLRGIAAAEWGPAPPSLGEAVT